MKEDGQNDLGSFAFWTNPIGRRDFGKYTLISTGAFWAILESACDPFPSEPPFPAGKTIGPEDLKDQGNLSLILDRAKSFPVHEAPTHLPNANFLPKIEQEFPSELTKKIKALGFGWGMESAQSRNLIFEIYFDDGVKLGDKFVKARTLGRGPVACLVISIDNQGLPRVFHPQKNQPEEDDVTADLRSLTFQFPITIDEVTSTDLIVILNHGLLRQQPNSAFFIPFRFRLQAPGRGPT